MDEFWRSVWLRFYEGLASLNLDLSGPTLTKYLLLLIAVIALLWVIGDVYRGELQNRNMPVDVIANDRPGYSGTDVLFTKRTFDTRSERLPASVIIEHRFLISHGDRQFSQRVRVLRRGFKLHAQPRQYASLRDGQFAFDKEIEKEIKNRAEYLVRQSLRRYRGRWSKPVRSKILKKLDRTGSRWGDLSGPCAFSLESDFPSLPASRS